MKKKRVVGGICLLLVAGGLCLGAWKRFAVRSLGAGALDSCCESLRRQGFDLDEKRVRYDLRAGSRLSLRLKSALNGLLPAALQRRREVLVFSRAGSSLTLDARLGFGRIVGLEVCSEQATTAAAEVIKKLIASQNPSFRVGAGGDTDGASRGRTLHE